MLSPYILISKLCELQNQLSSLTDPSLCHSVVLLFVIEQWVNISYDSIGMVYIMVHASEDVERERGGTLLGWVCTCILADHILWVQFCRCWYFEW